MQSWEEEGSCCHLVLSKTFMNEWSQSTVQWKAREASHSPRLDNYTFWTIHPSVELANEQNWHEGPWSLLEEDEPPLKLLILTEHVPVNLCKLQKLPAAPPTCACRESQEDVSELTDDAHTPHWGARHSKKLSTYPSGLLPWASLQTDYPGRRKGEQMSSLQMGSEILPEAQTAWWFPFTSLLGVTHSHRRWSLIWIVATVIVTDDLIVAVFSSFCLGVDILFGATDCCLTPLLASLSPLVLLLLLVSAFWTYFSVCKHEIRSHSGTDSAGWWMSYNASFMCLATLFFLSG